MKSYFELKHQAGRLLKQWEKLALNLGYETSAQTLKEIYQEFEKKELMVVAAGEARRGKSTLLNALLGETQPLFPEDINVCTNVVTVARYGREEKIEAWLEDGGSVKKESISRSDIENYVSEKGNKNNYKNVKLLNISIPNELLKEGVAFVDTPGVGSLNISHAEAAYGFLPNADMLLFVTDTNSGLTETELGFLKRGYQYCKNVIFPVTKTDANPDYSLIVEDNREKIRRKLGIPEEELQIIPVSSKAKLRSLVQNNTVMYENSNFLRLEEALWGMIAKNRAQILILPFLLRGKEELLKMADSIAAQYQLLNTDQDKMKKLVDSLKKEIRRLEDFQQDGAKWRNELNYFCTTLTSESNRKVQTIAAEARNILDANVARRRTEICRESVYTQILSEINNKIICGLLDIKKVLEGKLEAMIADIMISLGLDVQVNQDALDELDFVPDDSLQVVFPKKKATDRILSGGRKIGINSMAGTAVGSILGGIIGFCLGGPVAVEPGRLIGGALGGVFGTTKGCVDSLKKYDDPDIGVVNRAISGHISSSITALNTSVVNVIAQIRMSLSTEFELMLKKRVREIQENIGKLQKNINLAKADIPGKMAVLKKQSDAVNRQIADEEMLEAQITEFTKGSIETVLLPRHSREEKEEKEGAAYSRGERTAPASDEKIEYGFL